MPSLQSKVAIEQRNIEALASEFSLSNEEVGEMFEVQRAHLMQGARVGKYFPIFAVRNIRKQLELKRAALS
jgi:hypothetical protein